MDDHMTIARCRCAGIEVARFNGAVVRFGSGKPQRRRRAAQAVETTRADDNGEVWHQSMTRDGTTSGRRAWEFPIDQLHEWALREETGEVEATCPACGTVYPLAELVRALRGAHQKGRTSVKLLQRPATL